MALTATTVATACLATDLTIALTSTSTGFPAVGVIGQPQLLQLENEFMWIVQVPVAGQVKVRSRGAEGTAAVAHAALSPALTSATMTDFPSYSPGFRAAIEPLVPAIIAMSVSGAIAVPIRDTIIQLTKAGVAVMTLAAPSTASDGTKLTVTSETAQAHTITATSLIADGTSGAPHTTATFAAFKGATVVFEASNGLWNVVSLQGVTIS